MLEKLMVPNVRQLLAAGDEPTLAEALDRWLPADVACVLRELHDSERVAAFRLLKGPHAVHAFEYLDRQTQKRLLAQLPAEHTARLLNEMAPDDRTALFALYPQDEFERSLALMSEEQRKIARSLLQFPEKSYFYGISIVVWLIGLYVWQHIDRGINREALEAISEDGG